MFRVAVGRTEISSGHEDLMRDSKKWWESWAHILFPQNWFTAWSFTLAPPWKAQAWNIGRYSKGQSWEEKKIVALLANRCSFTRNYWGPIKYARVMSSGWDGRALDVVG